MDAPHAIVLGRGEKTHLTTDDRRTLCGHQVNHNVFDARGIGVGTYSQDQVVTITCARCARHA